MSPPHFCFSSPLSLDKQVKKFTFSLSLLLSFPRTKAKRQDFSFGQTQVGAKRNTKRLALLRSRQRKIRGGLNPANWQNLVKKGRGQCIRLCRGCCTTSFYSQEAKQRQLTTTASTSNRGKGEKTAAARCAHRSLCITANCTSQCTD